MPRAWLLDTLVADAAAPVLAGLGWHTGAPPDEEVAIELLAPATPSHRFDRLRLSSAGRSLELDVDLTPLQPHQDASVRLQCAIAFSRAGESGLLVHGAGLALPGRGAVVALAPSGGGKSTISNLATRFVGLSDETILLRPGPPPRISATPLRSSSQKVPEPRTEPLRALLFLEKNLVPSFTRMSASQALPLLLAQAYKLPRELATTAQLFKRASKVVENVASYRFAFPKAPEAEDLLLRLFDEELDPKDP